MQTVIMIRDGREDAEGLLDRLSSSFRIEEQPDGRYFISGKESHGWLGRDDEIIEDYDEDELAVVRRHVAQPVAFVLEFSDLDFGKQLLAALVSGEPCLVDNNHGDILRGQDFLDQLRERPSWDWRVKA